MTERKTNYDLPTAITFFLAGLGAGTFLAMILSPRANNALSQMRNQMRSQARDVAAAARMAPNLERLRAL